MTSTTTGEEDTTTEQTTCSICLCDIEQGVPTCVLLDCQHAFHTECITPWRIRQFASPTCPTCRTDIKQGCQHGVAVSDHPDIPTLTLIIHTQEKIIREKTLEKQLLDDTMYATQLYHQEHAHATTMQSMLLHTLLSTTRHDVDEPGEEEGRQPSSSARPRGRRGSQHWSRPPGGRGHWSPPSTS